MAFRSVGYHILLSVEVRGGFLMRLGWGPQQHACLVPPGGRGGGPPSRLASVKGQGCTSRGSRGSAALSCLGSRTDPCGLCWGWLA